MHRVTYELGEVRRAPIERKRLRAGTLMRVCLDRHNYAQRKNLEQNL